MDTLFQGSYIFSAAVSFASGLLLSAWFFRSPNKLRLQHIRQKVKFFEETKMVLVVRKDLKMGTGKIAAQCAHAAVAVVEEINSLRDTESDWVSWLDQWSMTGSSKVVVQCESEATFTTLANQAKSSGVPHYIIRDAGRTQIAAGSKTVLAIGPGPKTKIDPITSNLKLL